MEWDLECGVRAQNNCPNVCDCFLFADFDASGAIDLADYAGFQVCFSGDYPAYVGPGCECADYDGDNDSDLADFPFFTLGE